MHDTARELYYTFGNHMHWVDMEWLWGYFVLPASVRDMLEYCEKTGARGNVNFDAVGYERLAVEAPGELVRLRDAVASGTVEVVGGSYAQPYGLFHGGESNIRHLVYGVRTVLRHLGVRPVTFWEEEFYFFPQLPQMLSSAGFQYASLFFQWTWHTPSIPKEETGAVYWEGMDGSRILTATRNDLNIHQWPEDFRRTLEGPLVERMPEAGLVQWLELMPTDDWMCRSELLIPEMRKLAESGQFTIRYVTLSGYLEAARERAPVRKYGLQDVFHGMSLGKNGDLMRRYSRRAEDSLLAAETLSVVAGYLGRPYPSWDVYPTWELEEAWRELLVAQHHDVDECEGLCGHIGMRSYERSLAISSHVVERTLKTIARRSAPRSQSRGILAYNPLAWRRRAVVRYEESSYLTPELPALGYRVLGEEELVPLEMAQAREEHGCFILSCGGLSVSVNASSGRIVSLRSDDFGELLPSIYSAGAIRMTESTEGGVLRVERVSSAQDALGRAAIIVRYTSESGSLDVRISHAPELAAIDIEYSSESIPVPDPTMGGSLCAFFPFPGSGEEPVCLHDHPYGISTIAPTGRFLKKYPTGDWMTSPQVYEEVADPFTALSFVDLRRGDVGLQVIHDGSQALFFGDGGVWTILSMNDPWDEGYFVRTLSCRFRIVPHAHISRSELWRRAQEFRRGVQVVALVPSDQERTDVPPDFELIRSESPGIAVTALYRETPDVARDLPSYVGRGVDYPLVVRVVELDGCAVHASFEIAGSLASCVRSDLMGEALAEKRAALETAIIDGAPWTRVTLELGAHEIATLYADPIEARKQSRHLDDFRSVWAAAHRVGTTTAVVQASGANRAAT